jgi:hypothetical protein
VSTVAEVLTGEAQWACECADVLAWLPTLPDDSIDLLFTSPPYRKARTYGIGAGRDTEEWTAWMVEIVRAAAPKVKGLIAINCEGQTEDYQYHPTPYLLLADLHRAGFNARRPAFFHRIGIPGSGGPDWLRADVEPIICVTRPGKLPWSDNTACGHPPKWGPGGEMSNRLSNGTRINQWGKTGSMTGTTATGNKEKQSVGESRPSHRTATMEERARKGPHRARRDAGEVSYDPPVLANPGNVIQATYTADEVAALLSQSSEATHCVVGGGAMGHALAHDNEAPFPVELPTFFILSFCPPDGVVCDPFSGSGTTAHAARNHGRRFIGCDVRQSQVELCERRMATVTPALFA